MAAQKGIGRLIQFGVAKETTRGTAISSASYWNPFIDLTLDEKKEFVADEQSYGIIEDNVGMSQVKKWAEGSVSGNVHDRTIGLILYSVFGGYGVSGPSDSAYTHTFSIGQTAQHQSLTLFLHDPLAAQDYSYANGVVEKLEISAALKQFIQFTASVKAQSGVAQSNFTPSTTSENRFLPQHMLAKIALDYAGLQGTKTLTGNTTDTSTTVSNLSSTSTLRVGMTVSGTGIPAGATIATIASSTSITISAAATANGTGVTLTFGPATIALKSAKLTISSNVEDQEVLGSVAPADFLNKEFSVEGEFEAIWRNESDFKTQFMGPTTIAMRLDFLNTDVTIGSGTNPELYFDMPKVTIQELGRPIKVKDLVYQTVKFRASYSVSDTLMVKAVLVNAVSTY